MFLGWIPLKALRRYFRKLFVIKKQPRIARCKHLFDYKDMGRTGFVVPETPKSPFLSDYIKYNEMVVHHISHTHRVFWGCSRCRRVFYAHCGLDILKFGRATGNISSTS